LASTHSFPTRRSSDLLDDLKAKIRSDIEMHKRNGAREQMREKILEWLEDNNEFEVPSALVERQLEIRLQRLLRDLSRKGINPQRDRKSTRLNSSHVSI